MERYQVVNGFYNGYGARFSRSEGLDPEQIVAPLDQLKLNPEGPILRYAVDQFHPSKDADSSSSMVEAIKEIYVDESVDGFEQQSPLKLESLGVAPNLFDKMPSLHSMEQNEGNDNTEDGVLPVVCLSQVKGSEVDIKEEVFDTELKHDLSPKFNHNHLVVNGESLAPVKNGDQHFGSEADSITSMEFFNHHSLETDTFQLFDELPTNAMDKNMPHLASTQTIKLIKCKCKNRAPLTNNDVVFYFDPEGCTLSDMNFETSEFCGEQGGLSLAFGLAPNFADKLVKRLKTISHEPCIMNAYGCGVVIEYCGTEKEFVGEGSVQNAPPALCLIEQDNEGRKIDRAMLRNGLDSFVVIRMEQRDYYGNNVEAGQVFYKRTPTSVHNGLYVCDASLIPCSVGVNPCLTITIVAEHDNKNLVKDILHYKIKCNDKTEDVDKIEDEITIIC